MRTMVALALVGGVAHADDVNLLVNAPTTIAVSSTVVNAKIVPEHIADGKLATAWNSKTGELVDAWISIRVPADAKVKTIKLTAGFAHKDKSGDLFTMNPRIKKVRVSHNGKKVSEHALDVENRGLQSIAVDLAGGDIEVRVLEVVPGTKTNWKETCVSELEVWGSVAKPVKSKPAFRVGGLDKAATLTREQCIKALFPDARGNRVGPDNTWNEIVDWDVIPISEQLVVCRVDHKAKDSTNTTHELGAVKRSARPSLAGTTETFTTSAEPKLAGTADSGKVIAAPFPFTTTETGMRVDFEQTTMESPASASSESSLTLFRVSARGLESVFEMRKSSYASDTGDDGDHCTMRPVTPSKSMPTLVFDCTSKTWKWSEKPDGDLKIKSRVEKYRFKNGRYE